MKISIEAESQTEFEDKRSELINKLAGHRYSIEKSFKPVESNLTAQNEMVEYWMKRWRSTVNQMKKEIAEILDQKANNA